MEMWKIGVIGALLAGYVGYSTLQNQPLEPQAGPEPQNQATPPNEPPRVDPATLVGTKVKPWSIPAGQWMNSDRPLTPKDLQGKVTLLEFWRTGCSHCEEAAPFMNGLAKRYGPKLQIITFQSPGLLSPLNEETDWKKVQDWAKERGIAYPVAFDAGRKLKNQYQVPTYPFLMVADRTGTIRFAQTGHTEEKARALVEALESEMAK
jgi:thiol-disulfide isomerase/thioredoxin